MAASLERSALHVEGTDDFHTIKHLLRRHGIDLDEKPHPAQYPKLQAQGDVQTVLEAVSLAIPVSTGRTLGFVVDADSPIADRWAAVRGRLNAVGVDTSESPPAQGFIGTSHKYRSAVGVWLMPDNQHDGTLESLLRTLIAEDDPLVRHAQATTDTAQSLGARFPPADRLKARIHAWLAWQEEPGCPYGTAIRARYFKHDSPAADAFVAWFKTLFEIT